MSEAVTLPIIAGLPFTRRARLVDGRNIWGALVDFEARAQVRTRREPTATLITDLTPHLVAAYGVDTQANDIIVDLVLTGADTRAMESGHYDIVLSDTGTTDARGIELLHGSVTVQTLATAAADV